MDNYTTAAAKKPASPDGKRKPKVDPATYDPLKCKEYCNPNIILWERKAGLSRNITDAVIRYVHWSVVLAVRNGRHFYKSEETIAKLLGVKVSAVNAAVRRTTLF